jgi:hypothetical protein
LDGVAAFDALRQTTLEYDEYCFTKGRFGEKAFPQPLDAKRSHTLPQ